MRAVYHDVCKNKTFLPSVDFNERHRRKKSFICIFCKFKQNKTFSTQLHVEEQQLLIQPTTMYNLHIKIRVFFSLFATCIKYSISLTKIVLRHNYFDLIDSINTMMPLSIWSLWTYSLMLDSNDLSLGGVDLMFIFCRSQKK